MRDHEYERHGTLTLMAGIDLLTGHVHALVKERHRSREFIEFLKLLDAAYPADIPAAGASLMVIPRRRPVVESHHRAGFVGGWPTPAPRRSTRWKVVSIHRAPLLLRQPPAMRRYLNGPKMKLVN